MASLDELVTEWLRLDQNPATRTEIETLHATRNVDELERRMRKRIEFGTAGLRGRMQAGWSCMNDLIVIQASQGLCAYILQTVPNAASRGVVVGHDHRHNSEKWAKLTAAAFITRNVKTYLLEGLVHTPLVPFSVKRLNAAGGVMITASHNPKDDNGYKVYWENAVQIIAPHDKGIAESIQTNLEPKAWDVHDIRSSPLREDKTDALRDAYFAQLSTLSLHRSINSESPLKFVNTSMHGVSHPYVMRAFEIFSLPAFVPVAEQQEPNPDFPTVRFPNPEEKGALDFAMNNANKSGGNYVLAQDPDADRFAAAQRGQDGSWTMFTGDQLGTLFASATLDRYKANGKPLNKLAMVASTVSSKMIESMARVEGFKFEECLTGFKFIGNTALRLEQAGYDVPFGYEEAIGFMFGTNIRDKDGVAASVVFAEMVASLHRAGKNARSHLEELYERYGYFQTSNSYFICNDPPTIDNIFARIRNFDGKGTSERPKYPSTIAGLGITSVRDLTIGYDSSNPPSYKPTLPLSSGHMIQFRAESLADGTSVTLTTRTSGTEPKIKYYLEASGKDRQQVARLLPQVVAELAIEWMEADKNGLGQP